VDESVDLIYLDPPFNSKQDYNIIFRERHGARSTSQELVFEDTWKWSPRAEQTCAELVEAGGRLSEAIRACRTFLGDNDMMAYIAMMAPRLKEMHRVLKATESLYLHCDPTASHYLKMIMDATFGPGNFLNEIIWKRTTTKNDYTQGATNWPRIHDVLLCYGKDASHACFNQPFSPLTDSYVASHYRQTDEEGRHYQLTDLTAPGSGTRGHPQYEFMGVTKYWRYNKEKMERLASEGRVIQPRPGAVPRYKRYLDEMKGTAIGDMWWDISPINSQAQERLGYPTQKPIALLKRIIEASSNKGDTILDPFCGCGTAIDAAHSLERRWIGIDITHLALAIIKQRLASAFEFKVFKEIKITGEPVNEAEAEALAKEDKFGFQCWAVGRLGAPPH
jgi:adenine specific DNA methylase Mod